MTKNKEIEVMCSFLKWLFLSSHRADNFFWRKIISSSLLSKRENNISYVMQSGDIKKNSHFSGLVRVFFFYFFFNIFFLIKIIESTDMVVVGGWGVQYPKGQLNSMAWTTFTLLFKFSTNIMLKSLAAILSYEWTIHGQCGSNLLKGER